MPMLPLPRPKSSLVLLLSCALVFGGCASKAPNSQPSPAAEAAAAEVIQDDPFADDNDDDYLTGSGAGGVVGDDYFDDDYLDDYSAQVIIPDPLEPWNRFWFKFNDVFLEYAARPLNKGYMFVTPAVARKGLKNFFYNLRAPVRMINCLLQGKGQEAGVEFSSFMMNTVFGFGGLVDMAAQYKPVVPATNEDFGQTLGVWGVGEGVYLVWPFIGPSNVRDSVGTVGNYFMGYYTDPITQFGDFDWRVEIGITVLDNINNLDSLLKTYDNFKSIAIDPYTAMRDGYTQLRRNEIAK